MRLIDADALEKYLSDAEIEATRQRKYVFASALNTICGNVRNFPTIEPMRKNGKWIEKHHAYSDEESVIEEWQSCRCSECGRYDTRPYMYYFSEPNYCSYCGADMRGEENGKNK